jgi:hypothetical protein
MMNIIYLISSKTFLVAFSSAFFQELNTAGTINENNKRRIEF